MKGGLLIVDQLKGSYGDEDDIIFFRQIECLERLIMQLDRQPLSRTSFLATLQHMLRVVDAFYKEALFKKRNEQSARAAHGFKDRTFCRLEAFSIKGNFLRTCLRFCKIVKFSTQV